MQTIPVFARGGAVIPMWPDAPPSTAGYHPTTVELHLFVPGTDGAHVCLLQEDDGVSLADERGGYYRTRFRIIRTGQELTMHAEVDGDGYPGFARRQFRLVVHGAAPDVVDLDGTPVPATQGQFRLPNAGSPFVVKFRLL